MSDDPFDLGEPAESNEVDDSNSATTDNSSNTDSSASNSSTVNTQGNANASTTSSNSNNARSENNASTASNVRNDITGSAPKTTSAYDVDYKSTQRTIGVRDETWQDIVNLLEDSQAQCTLDGYREVTQLEAYEALFRWVLESCDAEDIASGIQAARHEVHGES